MWVVFCIYKPSQQFLQTFRPLRIHMVKIVFRDSSFYPKRLSLFCLLWLISASADSIGYITKFCSLINCCTSSETAVVNIEAIRHVTTSQQGKRKTKNLLDFCTSQKIESFLAYFMRILNSCLVWQDST